ncbi:DUF1501 domain-containing protein [Zavarzinella formosa]|uniref:DUF1501 domain-containing protein n=1 Tax=Zavarzinella formosa TaxID=360055 RepID=UPI00036A980D|nr:DUF1501 domain-containing protein [Zavarzinella formosa]
MLSHFSSMFRDCDGLHRRDLLKVGMLGGLGVTLPGLLASKAQAKEKARKTDVNCIVIWTRGGTSHHDTFDPKPEAPQSVRGEFGVIDTAVPGVKFAEILPNMGRELGRYALLRSWNPHNAGHGVADQYVLSGRPINPALIYPTYGSVVSHQKGFKTRMPPFVQLGNQVDRVNGGGTSGYLGQEHNPFEIHANPNIEKFHVRDITPPAGVDSSRLERRRGMLKKIDALQHQADSQPGEFSAMDQHQRAALDLITAPETKSAFDIGSEDPKLRDQYGRNPFGQSCLLARRLIESGVRLVTVSDGGWDTHANNFASLKSNLIPRIDRGLPTLLSDLEDRGLLSTTLVVWLTDFGRTPKVNSAGGRDHWASAGFAIMAGAGVPGGSVLGRTDGEGGRPTHDEYVTEDIAATIYTKLGIPLDLMTNTPDGRPIRLNEGRVIREWM